MTFFLAHGDDVMTSEWGGTGFLLLFTFIILFSFFHIQHVVFFNNSLILLFSPLFFPFLPISLSGCDGFALPADLDLVCFMPAAMPQRRRSSRPSQRLLDPQRSPRLLTPLPPSPSSKLPSLLVSSRSGQHRSPFLCACTDLFWMLPFLGQAEHC